MTKQGKYNLFGIILLPLAAVLAAAIATMNGVWEAYGKTYGFLFGINFAFILLVGILVGLPLLWIRGEQFRWLLISPTVIPAAVGSVWYLWSAVFPSAVAPGWQFIGVPQYLLPGLAVAVIFFLIAVIVLLLRLTGIVKKTA